MRKQKALYRGKLNIGGIEIQCAVTEDGMRVISQFALNNTFERPERGSKNLPVILDVKAIEPFIFQL